MSAWASVQESAQVLAQVSAQVSDLECVFDGCVYGVYGVCGACHGACGVYGVCGACAFGETTRSDDESLPRLLVLLTRPRGCHHRLNSFVCPCLAPL